MLNWSPSREWVLSHLCLQGGLAAEANQNDQMLRQVHRLSARARWTRTKRRRARVLRLSSAVSESVDVANPIESSSDTVTAVEELSVASLLRSLPPRLTSGQLARLLWTTDYWRIFALELQQHASISTVVLETFMTVRTSRQGAIADDSAALLRLSSTAAALAREHSRKAMPFSIVAKSISWLMQRVPNRIWAMERMQRRLISKQVCVGILDCMTECRPPPEFVLSDDVAFLFADQTYCMRGSSNRPERVQYVDHRNLPVRIERETVLNAVVIAVPRAVTPELGAAAVADIRENGVYRQPFEVVHAHIAEARVRANLAELLCDVLAPLAVCARQHDCSLEELSADAIAQALLGRPNVDPGGPSYFTVLPTVRDCSTQSYQDGYKIIHAAHAAVGQPAVLRLGGDGQLVLLLSYLKRKFPQQYKHVLIDSGDFHAYAHFLFGLNELFWDACLSRFARVLEIDNVYERMPNLENNNYQKVLSFHQAVALAIVTYLVKRVKSPPPELLLANPMAYLQQINSAPALVMFQCLLYVLSPEISYHRAIRSGDGSTIPKILAYAFHVHRTVHKTQEQQITLIALISYYCIHPALRLFKDAMSSLSLLGRHGANMAYDRLVEWINLRQSERSSSFQSYDGALQFTHRMQPMLHVDAAFSAAALGHSTDADAGYDPRVLNQVRRLLDVFERDVGDDLTVFSPNNPFWHTGVDVPLENGPTRERRPWSYVWEVAQGRLAGRQASPQTAYDNVQDRLGDRMFAM